MCIETNTATLEQTLFTDKYIHTCIHTDVLQSDSYNDGCRERINVTHVAPIGQYGDHDT